MHVSSAQIQELFGLLNRMLDSRLSKGQIQRLETLLDEQPVLREYYVQFFWLRSELHSCFSQSQTMFDIDLQESKSSFLAALPEKELLEEVALKKPSLDCIKSYADAKLAEFLAEQERLRNEQQRTETQRHWSIHLDWRRVFGRLDSIAILAYRSLVGGAVCVALMLIAMVLIQYYRSVRTVATLEDSMHAHWAVPPDANAFSPGWMILERGYARLRFKRAAEVLIQAPCEFNPCSPNRIIVQHGTLTAQVPPSALGFSVDTPNFQVVDFGTEFGVQVGSDQSARIQVFQGKIELQDSSERAAGKICQLTQGQAATADAVGEVTLADTADQGQLFARKMPSVHTLAVPGHILDLTDVVGGGNGFGTGELYWGLDPGSGRVSPTDPQSAINLIVDYIPLPSLPFVDGIFVPDSDGGRAQVISTTGLIFAECPDTSGYYSPSHVITNGARFQPLSESIRHHGRLRGQTYGTTEHPSLGMHANLGITFDLDQIRAAQPGYRIVSFRALCGLSETATQYTDGTYASHRVTAGFWVLVDGRLRFSRVLEAVPHETAAIDISLPGKTRFLTLVTTDNGFDRASTWAMFAEPILELAPRQFTNAVEITKKQ